MDAAQIREQLNFIIRHYILKQPTYPLADDTRLLGEGIVDSFAFATLILHIEESFAISIPDSDLTDQNLDSVDSLIRLIQAQLRAGGERSLTPGPVVAEPEKLGPPWTVQSYCPEDEQGILALFRQVLQAERTPEQWRWLYAENRAGHHHITVAHLRWACNVVAKDVHADVIGHFATIPVLVQVDDQALIFGQGADLMIRADHRGANNGSYLLYDLLSAHLDRYLKTGAEALVFGTANAIAYQSVSKWPDLCLPLTELFFLTRELESRHRPRKAKSVEREAVHLQPIRRIDHTADSIWQQRRRDYPIMTIRDQDYLRWRYKAWPAKPYFVYLIMIDREPVGIVVLGGFFYGGRNSAAVIDWIVPLAYLPCLRAIIAGCEDLARGAGADKLVILFPPHSAEFQSMAAIGYHKEDSGFPLCLLGPKFMTAAPDEQALRQHWFYTLGDFDLV